MSGEVDPIYPRFPAGVRCAVALSYDLEMCAGYAPDGVNHGRIMPALQAYTLRLCTTAEEYGVKLHFFYVANGLEETDIEYLREILRRGHIIDSHTYNHVGLAVSSPEQLHDELSAANRTLWERLGIQSTVLRGPYGYEEGWRTLPPANRRIILDNGFKWVSGEYDSRVSAEDWHYGVRAAERHQPYVYPEGLVEIPFQGWTDRLWFDLQARRDQAALAEWRGRSGHQAVAPAWRPPWTDARALDDWIDLNLACLDYAYEHHLLWVPCWHPYTHYLHDPDNRTLATLLQHAASKPERVWVCTLRDAARMLTPAASEGLL